MSWPQLVVDLLLAFAVLDVSRRQRLRDRAPRWVGDLRPGTQVKGPGINETWTVVSSTLSAERGQPPTLRLDLIAGAVPRPTDREDH